MHAGLISGGDVYGGVPRSIGGSCLQLLALDLGHLIGLEDRDHDVAVSVTGGGSFVVVDLSLEVFLDADGLGNKLLGISVTFGPDLLQLVLS